MRGTRASREAQLPALFRTDVEKLLIFLAKPGSGYAAFCKIVYESLVICRDVNREAHLVAVEHIFLSGAWPLLLRRLSEDLDSMRSELIPARAVDAGSGNKLSAAVGDTDAVARLQAHDAALGLLYACLSPAAGAASGPARGTSAASAGSGRAAGRSGAAAAAAALPRRLETLSRAARAALMSQLLQRYSRMAAQAADAAIAASGKTSDRASGSSSSSSRGGVESAGGGGAAAAVAAAEAVAQSAAARELGVVLATMIDTLMELSAFGRALQPLQPTVAAPPPPPAAAARAGGGGKGKAQGSKAATAAAAAGPGTIGGASAAADRTRPLAELVLLEASRSGFLDHVARLVVHSAEAGGRERLRILGQAQPPALAGVNSNSSCGDSSGGARSDAVQPPSRSGSAMALWLVRALCANLSNHAALTLPAAGADNSGDGGSSNSGSSSPPPPPAAGTWVRTAVVSQVVATLRAAGFGGGRGGVWGLPAELAAGLPILAKSDKPAGEDVRDHQDRSEAEAPYLCASPFSALNKLIQGYNLLALKQQAGDGGGDGDGWDFPVSRRATALVLVRVAALAAASAAEAEPLAPNAAAAVAAAGASSSGTVAAATAAEAGNSTRAAAAAARLRLHPISAWSQGMDALLQARQLLAWRRVRARLQQSQEEQTRAARRPSRAAAAAAAGSDTAASSSCPHGDEFGDVYPRLPVAWWRAAAAVLPAAVVLPEYWTMTMAMKAGAAPPSGAEASSAAWSQEMGRVLKFANMVLALDYMPPAFLPPAPPPGLAAALQGGLVRGVEAAVRAAPDTGLGAELGAAFLQAPLDGIVAGGCSWPLLMHLLAFAPPAQAAALVTSMGKRGQMAAESAASAAASGVGVAAAVDTVYTWLQTVMAAWTEAWYLGLSQPAAPSAAAGGGSSGSSGGGKGAEAEARLAPHEHQLRLLFSHTLHRWLPAASRCLRALNACRLADPPQLASHVAVVLHWAAPLLAKLAARDAIGAITVANSSGGPPGRVAATVAECRAHAASWRQLLLGDVQLLGLTEMALALLAVLPAGHPLAALLAQRVGYVLQLLVLALPEALAPLLQRGEAASASTAAPSPGSAAASAYGPDFAFVWKVQRVHLVLQTHALGVSRGSLDELVGLLQQLRDAARAAEGAGAGAGAEAGGAAGGGAGAGAEVLRQRFLGGPFVRSARVPLDVSPADRVLLAHLSPLQVQAHGGVAVKAAGAEAGGKAGEGAAGTTPAGGEPAVAADVARCCANPACVNLAGRSEAELPVSVCGGCRCVWYCGQDCQRAHWRAGHKQACAMFKGAMSSC